MSTDAAIEEDHYATAENFGGDVYVPEDGRLPFVKRVTVPESIKRRVPSKHYVYKVVIEWSNDNTVIIYRRYTHFFDFLVKLQQLVSSLIQKKLIEGPINLPELPGRVLFGRREVHQVAEKRRRKIEEFCQQLILLPPEISESSLVLGFFNTWPDDTLLRRNPMAREPVISNPVLTSPPPKHLDLSRSPPSQVESPPPLPSHPSSSDDAQLPSSTVLSPTQSSSSVLSPSSRIEQAVDAIISHPDEMENLEQYRVIGDYQRKDSHQVNLHTGQIVHVIEKHDTGWWMVMSDDEQGYAPAVYLESVEENSGEKDVHPEDSIDEVYEAMESFAAENEDEVGFKAGERVHVISKSMDGWWKIRCNDRVGYSPAALIRPKMSSSSNLSPAVGNFESEKFIYEEMNIHRPPPRRNTIDRTALSRVKPISNKVTVPPGYDSPRSNAALALHFDSDVYVDPAEEIYAIPPDDGDDELYAIPPELSDEEDLGQPSKLLPLQPPPPFQGNRMNGHAHPMTKTHGVKGSEKFSAPRKSVDPAVSSNGSSVVKTPVNGVTGSPPPASGDSKVSGTPRDSGDGNAAKSKPSIYDDTVFDTDNSKQAASDSFADDDAVYENTEFDQDSIVKSTLTKRGTVSLTKSVQSPTRHKPKRHTPDDYEDLEHFEGKSPTELIPALDDYVDMDGCEVNMYVASEELKRRGSDFSDTPTLSPRNALSPGPTIPAPPGIKSPPPLLGTKSQPVLSKTAQPIMEDEYVEMDSVPADLPGKSEPSRTTHAAVSDQVARPTPKPSRPSPPPRNEHKKVSNKLQSSQNVLNKLLKKSPLVRAKSMEDILSSSKNDYAEIPKDSSQDDYDEISRENSPTFEPVAFKSTPPPLPPPRVPGQATKRQLSVDSIDGPMGGLKSTYLKSSKGQKIFTNGHLPIASRGSVSPPAYTESAVSPSDQAASTQRGSNITKGQDSSSEMHAKREALLSQMIERMQTKYIALHSYSSPKDGCLSFSAGELCTVKQRKNDGWWLVRIKDKEGWTPGNYWKEETRSNITGASTPQKAYEVTRKPRSHTVATDTLASTAGEVTSSPESASCSENSFHVSSPSVSLEAERSPLSSSMDGSKPLLPSRPPPTRPKVTGPPPPRPRPYASTPQGSNVKKPKPPPPQKPLAVKLAARLSPSPGSPQERRKKKSVSPPLLPPPNQTRKFGSHHETAGHGTGAEAMLTPNGNDDEYVMLKDATTTVNDINTAPWFSGKMDRMQAEQFLMEYGRQREFLVRERTNKDGFYALSIRYHYSCKHFNIDPTADGQYSMGTLTFATIDEIIQHYQQNSLFIHEGQHVTLGQPAKKKTRGSDASKFH